ncbi:MAG: hypothetical protein IKP92_09400 [Lachnospiraceae bacterium]|nr:hypothetical protein [Lachnospiraceae bacterium]
MKKKITASIAALLVISLIPITAMASTSSAMLYTNETTKETGCVGNTSGFFRMWGSVGASSVYAVEFKLMGGSDSNNCTTCLKSESCASNNSFGAITVNANKNTYSVGKVVMYGNNYNYPMYHCIASAGVGNT